MRRVKVNREIKTNKKFWDVEIPSSSFSICKQTDAGLSRTRL